MVSFSSRNKARYIVLATFVVLSCVSLGYIFLSKLKINSSVSPVEETTVGKPSLSPVQAVTSFASTFSTRETSKSGIVAGLINNLINSIKVDQQPLTFNVEPKAKYLYVNLNHDGTYFQVQDHRYPTFTVDADKNIIAERGSTLDIRGSLVINGSAGEDGEVLVGRGDKQTPIWQSQSDLRAGGLDCTTCTITGNLVLEKMLANGGILYAGSSGSLAQTAVGTSGQVLVSNGGGAPTWDSLGAASIDDDSLNFSELGDTLTLDSNLAIGASGSDYNVNIDNGTLFVDSASNRLGIGTTSPGAGVQINTGADATKGLIIKANSGSQSANLTEWQDSSGTTTTSITSRGGVSLTETLYRTTKGEGAPFATLTNGGVLFHSTYDNVLTFAGYNPPDSSEFVSTAPSLAHTLESDFENAPGQRQMEWNFDYQPSDHSFDRRFLAFAVDRSTHLGEWAHMAEYHDFWNSALTTQYARIGINLPGITTPDGTSFTLSVPVTTTKTIQGSGLYLNQLGQGDLSQVAGAFDENGAVYHGFNLTYDDSQDRYEAYSTAAVTGVSNGSTGSINWFAKSSQTAGTGLTPDMTLAPNGVLSALSEIRLGSIYARLGYDRNLLSPWVGYATAWQNDRLERVEPGWNSAAIIAGNSGFQFMSLPSADPGTVLIERMRISPSGNVGIGTTTFGTSAAKVVALGNGTVPSTSIADGIQLYAEDVAASSELKVRDEAGNVTTLSPHNYSLFKPKEEYILPWSFYSRNDNAGKEINVDMYGAIQTLELLSGQKFIYAKDLKTGVDLETKLNPALTIASLEDRMTTLEGQVADMQDGTVTSMSANAKKTTTLDKTQGLTVNDIKDLNVKGTLTVHGSATFLGDINVKGRLSVSNQQAGFGVIPKGQREVKVKFDQPFSTVPVISVTNQEGNRSAIASVDDATTTEFTIRISTAAATDLKYSWVALAVSHARTIIGELTAEDTSHPAADTEAPAYEDDEPEVSSSLSDTLLPSPTVEPEVYGTPDTQTEGPSLEE